MRINSASSPHFGRIYRNNRKIYVRFPKGNIDYMTLYKLANSDTNHVYITETKDKFDVCLKTPKEEIHYDNKEFHSPEEALLCISEKLYPAVK